jgi:pimeloyl-ACP methyl ester carboxylesterase
MIEFRGRDGARLEGDSIGEGRPVILLHGGGQTRGSWRRTAQALAEAGYRAVSVDARGHGESDWATEGYSLQLLADDLKEVIRTVEEAPALVGASLGGLTSLAALGGDEPVPASALVLVDIAVQTRPEGREQIHAFMSAYPDGFETVEEAADAVSEYLTSRPRPANVAGLRKNLRTRDGRLYWHWDPGFLKQTGWTPHDLDGAARRVSVPSLLVYGEHSEIVDRTSIDHLCEVMPHIEVAEVKGAGHMVAGDANSAFAGEILAFLARRYPA